MDMHDDCLFVQNYFFAMVLNYVTLINKSNDGKKKQSITYSIVITDFC